MGLLSSGLTAFGRFWNSSFGIPQQLLFRALRVAQGKASFTSEEGFGDFSLFPVLGAFDSDRKDVAPDEMVSLINQAAGTNLDEDSFLTQLGVGIGTDPLSILASPLTAGAKSAQAVLKGVRRAPLASLLDEGGEAAALRLGKKGLASKFDEALSAPVSGMSARDRRLLTKGRDALAKVEGDDLTELFKGAGKREQALALPIIGSAVGPKLRVSKEYQSWFQLLRDKSGTDRAMAAIAAGPIVKIPGIRHVVEAVGAVKDGVRSVGLAPRALQLVNAQAKGDLSELGTIVGERSALAKKLGAEGEAGVAASTRLLNALSRGNETAIVRAALGAEADVKAGIPRVLKMFGVSSLDEITPDTLKRFVAEYDDAVAGVGNFQVRNVLKEEFKGLRQSKEDHKFLFGVGSFFAGAKRKIFQSDLSFAKFDEVEKDLRTIFARDTEQLEELAKVGSEKLALAAKEMGEDPEFIEALTSSIAQIQHLPDELAGIESATAGQVGEMLSTYADRSMAIHGQMLRLLEGKTNPVLQDARAALVAQGGLFDGMQLTGHFDELDHIPVPYAAPKSRHAPDRHLLAGEGTGRERGRYIGHLTDRQLSQVQRRLQRKATRVKTQDELASIISKDEGLSQAAESIGLTPAELAEQTMRRRTPPNMLKVARLRLDAMEANQMQTAATRVKEAGLNLTEKVEVIERLLRRPGAVVKKLKSGKLVHGIDDSLRPVVAMLKGKGFTDTDDILDALTAARFVRPSALEPAVHRLTEQGRSVFALSRQIIKKEGAAFEDLSILSRGERADLHKIRIAQKLRAEGQTSRFLPGQPIKVAGRVPTEISATLTDAEGNVMAGVALSDKSRVMGKIFVMANEARRQARLGLPLNPTFITELRETMEEASALYTQNIIQAMRESGAGGYLDFIGGIRQEILNEAIATGTVPGSRPLAYMSRIHDPQAAQAITEMFGRSNVRSVIDAQLPTLNSQFRRSGPSYTIEELNSIHDVFVGEGMTETAAELAKHMEAMGIKPKTFTESPVNSLLARLSQSNQRLTVMGTVDRLFDIAKEEGAVRAGRVVEVLNNEGSEISGLSKAVGEPKSFGKTTSRTADTTTVSIGDVQRREGVSGIIVEDHQGERFFISAREFGNRASGMRLGKFADAESGRDVNKAFARATGGGGRVDKSKIFGQQPLDAQTLDSLKDEFVVLGEQSVWEDMVNAYAKQWDDASDLLSAVDTGINMMKRFQTSYRPLFHAFNLAGSYFQARAVGATFKGMALGTVDAFRFLHDAPELIDEYSRIHNIVGAGAEAGGRTGFFHPIETVRGIRAAGRQGFERALPDALWRGVGGDVSDVGEMIDAMLDAGVFSTRISQGLRATSSVPKRLELIRKAAIDPNAAGKVSRVLHKVDDISEASETVSRLNIFFSLKHSGQSVQDAARNTALAAVPYHQLTRAERNVAKRIFSFYSFPRHYTGVAYKFFAQNPDRAANLAHAITAEGGIKEDGGRLVLDTAAGRLNIGRLDPNLEALGTLTAWGKLFTTPNASIQRQLKAEGIRTELPALGEPGPQAQVATDLLQGDVRAAGEEIRDAFWPLRFIFSPDDPLKETSGLTKLNDNLLNPFPDVRQEHTKRVIIARYNSLKRDLARKLKIHSDDPYLAAQYTQELRNVEAVLTRKLQEIPQK